MSERELQEKLNIAQSAKEERTISDERYAAKIVEKIVFSFIGTVTIGVVIAILSLVIKKQ